MATIVVSHLTEISDEAIERANKKILEINKKLRVVILRETRCLIGATDIGKAKLCKLEIWNGNHWEEILFWAEGEGWHYGYIGREFMEDYKLTGIWAYKFYDEEDEAKEIRVRLFKNGEIYYGYTSDEEGTDFYDFREERKIEKKVFEKEFKKLLKEAGFPL